MKLGNTLSKLYSLASNNSLKAQEAVKGIEEILESGETPETKTALTMALVNSLTGTDKEVVVERLLKNRFSEDSDRLAIAQTQYTLSDLYPEEFDLRRLRKLSETLAGNADIKAKIEEKITDLFAQSTPDQRYDMVMNVIHSGYAENYHELLGVAVDNIDGTPDNKFKKAMQIVDSAGYRSELGEIKGKAIAIALEAFSGLEKGTRIEPALKLTDQIKDGKWSDTREYFETIPAEFAKKASLYEAALEDLPTSSTNLQYRYQAAGSIWMSLANREPKHELTARAKQSYGENLQAYLSEFAESREDRYSRALEFGKKYREEAEIRGETRDIVLKHARTVPADKRMKVYKSLLEKFGGESGDFPKRIKKEMLSHLRKLPPAESLTQSWEFLAGQRIHKDYHSRDLVKPVAKILLAAHEKAMAVITDPQQRYELTETAQYNAQRYKDDLDQAEVKLAQALYDCINDLPDATVRFDAKWKMYGFGTPKEINAQIRGDLIEALPALEPEKLCLTAFSMYQWGSHSEETRESIYGMIFSSLEKLPQEKQREIAREIQFQVRHRDFRDEPKKTDLEQRMTAIIEHTDTVEHPPMSTEEFLQRMAAHPAPALVM